MHKVWELAQRERRFFGKRQAIMNLRESVYWYTMTTMYLDGNLTRLPPATSDVMGKVGVLKKFTEQMAQRCWEIVIDQESVNRSDVQRKIEDSLGLFELFTGVTTEVKPTWTFSNALFLAVTIYTTIGETTFVVFFVLVFLPIKNYENDIFKVTVRWLLTAWPVAWLR